MKFPTRQPNVIHWTFFCVLICVSMVLAPFAAIHLDLARDVFVAWRLLHGVEYPWTGPVLAGVVHLGPVWYWLLALLLKLGDGLQGAVLLLAFLGSMQFPLAYLLGKELQNRRAGFLWSLGLLLPSWSTFENLLPLHYVLTAPLVLAFLLCALRYWRNPRRRYLVAATLALSLALHAHPTCIGLAWVWIALLTWAFHGKHCAKADVAIAILVGLLPLIPYLIWDGSHGFSDMRSGLTYIGGGGLGAPTRMLPVLWAATLGGTKYWLSVMLQMPKVAVLALTAVLCALGLLGVYAFSAYRQKAKQRQYVTVFAFAVVSVWFTTTIIRDATPFYMTTPLHVLMIGIVALGLTNSRPAITQIARPAFVLVSLVLFAAATIAFARFQSQGSWPFSFFPLFDTTADATPTKPLPLMPAYAMSGSGKFLCAQKDVSAHGDYARNLLYDYAVEMQIACGRHDVLIGGSETGREHWLGLSRALLADLRVQPVRFIGPIGLLPAIPLARTPGIAEPRTPIYPSYTPQPSTAQRARYNFRLRAGQHIAIANLAYFVPDPAVTVSIDGLPIGPAASDAITTVYSGLPEHDADALVYVESSDFADLDIVAF